MNTALEIASPGSLVCREDLLAYPLAVAWSEERRWRDSRIALPNGVEVAIDQYVGANFQRPRMYHPEYALAIELLLLNAVTEAKARGFQVVAVELGVWAYRSLIELGKRTTKVGLAEPMLLEDGRTLSHVGYQWIDHENEGVLLVPWANGDQLIRLKDSRGFYVVPVDERTADASQCPQAWDVTAVQSYKKLRYDGHDWDDQGPAMCRACGQWDDGRPRDFLCSALPQLLLESADPMVVRLDCQSCKFLLPTEPDTFVKDTPSGKRVCKSCKAELEEARTNAAAQGWDFDTGKQLPPSKSKAPSFVLVDPTERVAKMAAFTCTGTDHAWGMQMKGTSNAALTEEQRARGEGMTISRECIICGVPMPKELRHKEKD